MINKSFLQRKLQQEVTTNKINVRDRVLGGKKTQVFCQITRFTDESINRKQQPSHLERHISMKTSTSPPSGKKPVVTEAAELSKGEMEEGGRAPKGQVTMGTQACKSPEKARLACQRQGHRLAKVTQSTYWPNGYVFRFWSRFVLKRRRAMFAYNHKDLNQRGNWVSSLQQSAKLPKMMNITLKKKKIHK